MEQQESWTFALLLVWALASGASGEALPSRSAGIQEASFAASARTVRLPVSILDKSGRPVTGLVDANFEVWENGKRQMVTLFSSARQPMRIALALDMSRSMEDKIELVEEALNHFIGVLEAKDEIMVIAFNHQVRVLQDFTSDREQLESVFAGLQPSGGTALYDAVDEAIQRVANGPSESKAVVLVSDGVNTESDGATFAGLLARARWSEVPIFSIGLDGVTRVEKRSDEREPRDGGHGAPEPGGRPGNGGSGNFGSPKKRVPGHGPWGGGRSDTTNPPPAFDGKALQLLAEETGGSAEIIMGPEHYDPGDGPSAGGRLRKAVESIALTLRHRYLIGYEPPEGKPGWRTIKIKVEAPRGATMRSRKGYFAEK